MLARVGMSSIKLNDLFFPPECIYLLDHGRKEKEPSRSCFIEVGREERRRSQSSGTFRRATTRDRARGGSGAVGESQEKDQSAAVM
jgi:hypothetical protein